MRAIIHDVRYAVRQLRKRPLLSATAILIVALGIGSNAALFSVVNAVLLRQLPYPDADRLVSLLGTRDGAPTPHGVLSPPDVADYRSNARTLVEVGGVAVSNWNLTGPGDPAVVRVGRVTPGFFAALGLRAMFGRLPVADEYAPGTPGIVVLDHDTWQARFAGDSAVVGSTVRFDETPFTVVGVLARDPLGFPDARIGAWVPIRSDLSRGSRNLLAVARLQARVTPATAQDELSEIAGRLATAYPESNAGRGLLIRELRDTVVGPSRPALLLLSIFTLVLLLIACANLGNLLLMRVSRREGEILVRVALGSGRWRLARGIVVESLLIVSAGAVAGLILGRWAVEAFLALAPTELPRSGAVAFDTTVFAFAVGLSLLTALAAGLAPVLSISLGAIGHGLRRGLTVLGPGRRKRRLNGALVTAQVALSSALLVAAALLLASFVRLRSVPPGFETESRLTFNISLPRGRYDGGGAASFYTRLSERLERLPGVRRVGAVSALPLSGHNLCDTFSVNGGTELQECAEFRVADPRYFATVGIELIEGRGILDSDEAADAPVALVNRSLASRAWPDRSPIGRTIEIVGLRFRVVGVVEDIRHFGLDRPAPLEVYAPLTQATLPWLTYVLETGPSPLELVGPVQQTVWSLDAQLPLREVTSLDSLLAANIASPRFRAALAGTLATIALALAMLGIYAVLGHSVATAVREIGVRMALGASQRTVVSGVVLRGLALTGVGLGLGVPAASLVSRFLTPFLYQTGPLDRWALLGTAVCFLVVAAFASYLPARRAAATDPTLTLRQE